MEIQFMAYLLVFSGKLINFIFAFMRKNQVIFCCNISCKIMSLQYTGS